MAGQFESRETAIQIISDSVRLGRTTHAKSSEFELTTFDNFFTLRLGNLKATLLKSTEEIGAHRAILLTVP